MIRLFAALGAIAFALVLTGVALGQEKPDGGTVRGADKSGGGPCPGFNRAPWNDPNFFPLGVWCQDPKYAAQYKAAGINLYKGIWHPPGGTILAQEIAPYEKTGLPLMCGQTEGTLQYVREHPEGVIVGWLQGDEPDNVQDPKRWPTLGWNTIEDINAAWPEHQKNSLEEWGKHGPPIPPKTIVAKYEQWRKNDPTRPILLNFNPGAAWEGFLGRGCRTGKVEDYAQYMKGCDLASFDIYPVTDATHKAITGKLWYLARGVENLRKWNGDQKPVWTCIECTHIDNENVLPSPDQIRTEVWMALIAGCRGIDYFCHEFKPKHNGAGLLSHPEQLQAVTAINKQITALAPVLNSPTIPNGAAVKSSNAEVPVSVMVKTFAGTRYVFAVALRDQETTATFTLKDTGDAVAEVLGENRSVAVKGGLLADKFKGYDVHLYKLKVPAP